MTARGVVLAAIVLAITFTPASAEPEPCGLPAVDLAYDARAARAVYDFDASACSDEGILRFELSVRVFRSQRPVGQPVLVARNNLFCQPGDRCTVATQHVHAQVEYAGYSASGTYVMELSDGAVHFGVMNAAAGGCASMAVAAVCGLP